MFPTMFCAAFCRRLAALCVVAALFGAVATADTLQIRPDAPERYVVVKGDTLWDISERFLDSPWRWPELWRGNPHIQNPHLIYPGDILTLVFVDGEPRLQITRAGQPLPAVLPPPAPRPGLQTEQRFPRARATPIRGAIPVVNIEDIQRFLRELSLLDSASIVAAPYIVSAQEGRIMAARGDRVYAMGMSAAERGDKFHIYHIGKPVRDPDTDEVIAYEGIFVGDAELERLGRPSTLLLTATKRETATGDRLLTALDESDLTDFYPKPPDTDIAAKILNVIDGGGMAGLYQSVVINAGIADGLQRGDVLSTFTRQEIVEDTVTKKMGDVVRLPARRSGTLMVIKPFARLSYALVMESRLPLRVHDEVRAPE